MDAAQQGCDSRQEQRLLEGVESGGLGSAVQAPRGTERGALTASWWAHCGATPGAHGARPGAGGGGGCRARGAAATNLQERAARVMARAGQCAGAAPPRPELRVPAARTRLPPPAPRALGAVPTATPPCPRAPNRPCLKQGRGGGGAGPARCLPGERARGAPRARLRPPPALEEPGESLGRGPGRGPLHRALFPESGCQAPRSRASQPWVAKRGATHAGVRPTAWLGGEARSPPSPYPQPHPRDFGLGVYVSSVSPSPSCHWSCGASGGSRDQRAASPC